MVRPVKKAKDNVSEKRFSRAGTRRLLDADLSSPRSMRKTRRNGQLYEDDNNAKRSKNAKCDVNTLSGSINENVNTMTNLNVTFTIDDSGTSSSTLSSSSSSGSISEQPRIEDDEEFARLLHIELNGSINENHMSPQGSRLLDQVRDDELFALQLMSGINEEPIASIEHVTPTRRNIIYHNRRSRPTSRGSANDSFNVLLDGANLAPQLLNVYRPDFSSGTYIPHHTDFFRIFQYQDLPKPVLSNAEINRLPLIKFRQKLNEQATSSSKAIEIESCIVCLVEYNDGENLRKLPCCHSFHDDCIKQWLTKESTSCPSCRYDIRKALRTKIKSPVSSRIGQHHNRQTTSSMRLRSRSIVEDDDQQPSTSRGSNTRLRSARVQERRRKK